MSPKKGTTIDLTVTSTYDPMPVDNTGDKLVSARAQIDTAKAYYQPATSNLFSSSSTPRTASIYSLSTSALFPAF